MMNVKNFNRDVVAITRLDVGVKVALPHLQVEVQHGARRHA
jgi:hypothetical protein